MRALASVAFSMVFVVVAAAVVDASRGAASSHYLATQRYEDVYYLPPNDWLQLFSLGHREAAASLVFIKALINFGDEVMHSGPVQYFYHYADAALALDPHFRRVYLWAGSLALYRPKEVSLADCLRSIDYLKRAHDLFPNDGDIAWQLGATYFYELPPLVKTEEERLQAQRDGLDYLRAAALLGAGPAWAGLNAASAMTRLGRTEQAMRHLLEIYTTIDNPAAKAEIEARILRLRDASFVEGMRHADRQLRRLHEAAYPYMSADLYLLVGPRPAFDGTAQLKRYFDPLKEPALITEMSDR